jgi:hypothetical protein
MSHSSQSKIVFIDVAFSSSSSGGTLQNIVLIGLPVRESANGELIDSDDVTKCFDDLIVRKLFRESRSIHECNFQSLKIWLYDTRISNKERGYDVPTIDQRDLSIPSKNSSSKLKTIYVLDNELEGEIYREWKEVCQKLFSILFTKFVTFPEQPQVSKGNFLGQLLGSLENIDPYAKEKKELTFDSLIIQVD